MLTLLHLVIRRSVRNAPLTLAVLIGLLVLVILLVAAPVYTSALANAGLQSTLADAPLDQRSIRVVAPTSQLAADEYNRLNSDIRAAAERVGWLKPQLLGAIQSKRLALPGDDTKRRVVLAEAEGIADQLHITDGRLPQPADAEATVEVALSKDSAERFGVQLGDQLPLAESPGAAAFLGARIVGIIEPLDRSTAFWQSGLLDLQPIWTEQQREATLLVASGTLLQRVAPALPAGRASGSYGWRVVWDVGPITGSTAAAADAEVLGAVRSISQLSPTIKAETNFGGILADYQRRLSIARAPLLLLLTEIAGLALIYIAWTAAFQAEATASEQSVMAARGASMRQIVGVSSGQAGLLAAGAALVGIPITLAMIQLSIAAGPVASQLTSIRISSTPDAGVYAVAASIVGMLTLALPAIPAARRSIISLRQGSARPATLPFWQRTYLDLAIVALTIVAFVQLQRQGSVLQQLRGRFAIDPFLLLAPLLMLISGALLILRAYLVFLSSLQRVSSRLRGLPTSLALLHLSRNRAASTRLVLLLALAVALGVFAQTFGATLNRNQQLRADYTVGADGRAKLTSEAVLLPGSLPAEVRYLAALRTEVQPSRELRRNFPGTLLAIDPQQYAAVAFNPLDQAQISPANTLAALGDASAAGGIALEGQPREISVLAQLKGTPFTPAVMLSDAVGRFHRLPMTEDNTSGGLQRYKVQLDLPAAAYPVRLVSFVLLPTGLKWQRFENEKDPVDIAISTLSVDDTAIERWDRTTNWTARTDTLEAQGTAQAGEVTVGSPINGRLPVEIKTGRWTRAVLFQPNPQPLEPIPVVANEAFLEANLLRVGQRTSLTITGRQVPVHIVDRAENFPTLGVDSPSFVVAHGQRLMNFLNSSYDRPVAPNELWLDLPDDQSVVQQLRTTQGLEGIMLSSAVQQGYIREPLAVGIAGALFLGFVTSVALAALGFAVATYLTGRRRTVEFAVLRALGLNRNDVLYTLAIEQGLLVALALLAGAVLGAALSRLILPLMAISDQGRALIPPYVVVVPWQTLAFSYAALAFLFVAVLTSVLLLLLRRGVGSALRIGEE